MQNDDLHMGNRPSRQRRHLPVSITSSVTERVPKKRRVPLIKMSSLNENKTRIQTGKRRVIEKVAVKDKKKLFIWFISAIWIFFILFRAFFALKQQDFGNLSLVHFISNIVNGNLI